MIFFGGMPHNRQGFLVVEYPGSHDKYEGEWVLGKKEGKGRYTSNTGGFSILALRALRERVAVEVSDQQ